MREAAANFSVERMAGPARFCRFGSHGRVRPASILAELLEPVLQAVFQMGYYYIGRLIVPAISLGRWKCDRLLRDVPKKKRRLGGL